MNLIEWLFSKQCSLCGEYQAQNNICLKCYNNFEFLVNACIKCQEPFDFNIEGVKICEKCTQKCYDFYETMHSALIYNEFVKNLIVQFKNGSHFFLAPLFAKLIYNINENIFKNAILVPIPLYYKRLIWRGYNQSYVLAKALAKISKTTMKNDILFRKKDTNSQALKKIAQRYENMEGAFELYDNAQVKDNNFILVDDVITTGATMFEAAKVLHENGANNVKLVCIARRLREPRLVLPRNN